MSLDRAEFEPFRCEVDPDRASVRVRPVGELDLATVPIVDAQLSELVAAGFTSLVLDLRELRFLDSTGLRLLLSWEARSRAEGVALTVIPGPAPIRRVIDVAGVAHLLSFSRLSQAGGGESAMPGARGPWRGGWRRTPCRSRWSSRVPRWSAIPLRPGQDPCSSRSSSGRAWSSHVVQRRVGLADDVVRAILVAHHDDAGDAVVGDRVHRRRGSRRGMRPSARVRPSRRSPAGRARSGSP